MKKLLSAALLASLLICWMAASAVAENKDNKQPTAFERVVESAKTGHKLIMVYFCDEATKPWQKKFEVYHVKHCISGVLYYKCDKSDDPDGLFGKYGAGTPLIIFLYVNPEDGSQSKYGSMTYTLGGDPSKTPGKHFAYFNDDLNSYREFLLANKQIMDSLSDPNASLSLQIGQLKAIKEKYDAKAKLKGKNGSTTSNLNQIAEDTLSKLEKHAERHLDLADQAYKNQNYEMATNLYSMLLKQFSSFGEFAQKCRQHQREMLADPAYLEWKKLKKIADAPVDPKAVKEREAEKVAAADNKTNSEEEAKIAFDDAKKLDDAGNLEAATKKYLFIMQNWLNTEAGEKARTRYNEIKISEFMK